MLSIVLEIAIIVEKVGIDKQKAKRYFDLAKSHDYHEKSIIKEILQNIPKLLKNK